MCEPYIYNYLTNDNNFYIMREDLLPFSFGGNKARKNDYYFNEILFGNFDHVITYGAKTSNHARIVSNFAAKNGIRCTIITPDLESVTSYNSKINDVLNANTIYTTIDKVKETIDNTIKNLASKGEKPYFIQGGAHGFLGTKAYVDTYQYILNYTKNINIHFDYIFFASGTGATQAGLIIGNHINQKKTKIVGISVARSKAEGRSVIEKSIKEYFHKEQLDFSVPIIHFNDNFVSGGYGEYNDEIKEYIKKYYTNYGIPLDPTYTGKAVYGMHNLIEEENIKNKNILFIHTGGTPLFFDFIKEDF